MLEMSSARLYPFWNDLTEALRTGKPRDELQREGRGLFDVLCADPARLERFMRAGASGRKLAPRCGGLPPRQLRCVGSDSVEDAFADAPCCRGGLLAATLSRRAPRGTRAGVQMASVLALAEKVDVSRCATLCDVGGTSGALCAAVARRHPTVRCTTLDLPAVAPIAQRTLAAAALAERVTVASGDFMTDALPRADVITTGNILHDWGTDTERVLVGLRRDGDRAARGAGERRHRLRVARLIARPRARHPQV